MPPDTRPLTDDENKGIDNANGFNTGDNAPLLAGKYKTESDLLQGLSNVAKKVGVSIEDLYKRLETTMGTGITPELEALLPKVAPVTPTPDPVTPEDKTKKEESLGVLDKYIEKIRKTNKLDVADYEELAKKGISPTMADLFIKGVQADGEVQTQRLYDIVGGSKEYEDIVAWGTLNMPSDFHKRFNTALDEGSFAEQQEVIRDLQTSYIGAHGLQPTILRGNKADNMSGVAPYETREDLILDMSKQEYKTSPAYRAKIKERLALSTFE